MHALRPGCTNIHGRVRWPCDGPLFVPHRTQSRGARSGGRATPTATSSVIPICACGPIQAVTPPAVALPAAITYYESMGQNWERAAMIKARPVAGDLALGSAFLQAIRSFVWRRGLDFAAVADIHAMKRRIDEYKGGALADAVDPLARIAGHNVKLGEGGIREIEFLAQTLQLGWPRSSIAGAHDAGCIAHAGSRRPRAAQCRARTGRGLPLPAARRASPADDRRPPSARAAAAARRPRAVRHVHGLQRRGRVRCATAVPSPPGAGALR